MRTRRHRHPVLEAAVFAAVLLLAAFVGRELWKRRATAIPSAPVESSGEPFTPMAVPAVPVRGKPVESYTERGTTFVPGIKLSRPPKSRRKRAAPPAPRP